MRTEETSHATSLAEVLGRLDALSSQVTLLVEQKRKQDELFSELSPILKEVMSTATTRLDSLEKRGYFSFASELGGVAQRIVEGFTPDDVKKLGDAVVSILETVRALTQPEVLSIAGQASQVIQNASSIEPMGIVGMVRSTRNEDVQRGMAVMMEVLKHVGRAADAMAQKAANSPAQKKRDKLAELTGARRKSAVLGVERPPPRAAQVRAASVLAAPAGCAVPAQTAPVAVATIDGIAFTADGHLADAKAWTRELAISLASAQGVALSEAHWSVVDFARADFESNNVSPNIRRLTQGTGLSTRDLYTLFPKAPARTVAKVAGIPKPAGCI